MLAMEGYDPMGMLPLSLGGDSAGLNNMLPTMDSGDHHSDFGGDMYGYVLLRPVALL